MVKEGQKGVRNGQKESKTVRNDQRGSKRSPKAQGSLLKGAQARLTKRLKEV